jgi:histidine ammonia-lyase
MGTIAARKLASVVANYETVVGIELALAAQALDFRAPLRSGRGTSIAHSLVRDRVTHLDDDRPIHADILACTELVRSGALVRAVEDRIGVL